MSQKNLDEIRDKNIPEEHRFENLAIKAFFDFLTVVGAAIFLYLLYQLAANTATL